MKPAFQGQEDPRIGEIDDKGNLILLKLRIMMRAKNPQEHRAELREWLQDYADRVMAFANACSNQ
jgi:hypothetical protein